MSFDTERILTLLSFPIEQVSKRQIGVCLDHTDTEAVKLSLLLAPRSEREFLPYSSKLQPECFFVSEMIAPPGSTSEYAHDVCPRHCILLCRSRCKRLVWLKCLCSLLNWESLCEKHSLCLSDGVELADMQIRSPVLIAKTLIRSRNAILGFVPVPSNQHLWILRICNFLDFTALQDTAGKERVSCHRVHPQIIPFAPSISRQ